MNLNDQALFGKAANLLQETIGLNIFISQIDTYMYNNYKHYK